jgi:hypothetical protein
MIHSQHYQEWLDSGIAPSLIELNLKSLSGNAAAHYLFYSEQLPRRNSGRLSEGFLKRYDHIEDGGWWCGTVDPLTGESSLWGCFKPNSPRIDLEKRKPIKYEHPPKVATEIFFLKVSYRVGFKIARSLNKEDEYKQRFFSRKYPGQEIPEKDPTREDQAHPKILQGIWLCDEDSRGRRTTETGLERYQGNSALELDKEDKGFWAWVLADPSIPLTITEGAKKAGSLLTAGYVAIALPGVWNGYRKNKDELGNKVGLPYLIPQLEAFAHGGREFNFGFDHDIKPTTVQSVREAITQTGNLLVQKGCQVNVIQWTYPEKGVDDLLRERGEICFAEIYKKRQSLEAFKLSELLDISPYVNETVNQRYLDIEVPKTSNLIAIRSPKGTGKTQLLSKITAEAINKGQPVLVIGHRIKLMTELAQRFGVNYRTEALTDPLGTLLGYALCIDSLHADAAPPFDPNAWENAIIIIDECEQVLWHLLNSSTCHHKRVSILENLKNLLQVSLATGGKLYISDADLSPISLNYFTKLVNFPPNLWVVNNNHNPNEGKRKLHTFLGNDPRQLLAELINAIQRGEKVFVCLSAQKLQYQWSTQNLERLLKDSFPDKSLLRIDRESVSEPNHPAVEAMEDLNTFLPRYDIVLASPTIETGVSITSQHFDSVWAIASGVQTVNAVAQAIERVREDVPRYIWARAYSSLRIGNGATNVRSLLKSQHESYQALAGQLSYFDSIVAQDQLQPETLICWSKYALLLNANSHRYRDAIVEKLTIDGYDVHLMENTLEGELVKELIAGNKESNYQALLNELIETPNPDEKTYTELMEKRSLTPTERLLKRKGELHRRYLLDNISEEIIRKDDQGWYYQIRLHYYLADGRQYLKERDLRTLSQLAEDNGSKVFKPDVNRILLTNKVRAFELLGLGQFLDTSHTWSKQDLEELHTKLLPFKFEIRSIFGLTVRENSSPIKILQNLLEQLGLRMTCIGRLGSRGDRQRMYQLKSLSPDGRDEIFRLWFERDTESTSPLENNPIADVDTPPIPIEKVPESFAEDVAQLQGLIISCLRGNNGLTSVVKAIIQEVFQAIPLIKQWLWSVLDKSSRIWLLST